LIEITDRRHRVRYLAEYCLTAGFGRRAEQIAALVSQPVNASYLISFSFSKSPGPNPHLYAQFVALQVRALIADLPANVSQNDADAQTQRSAFAVAAVQDQRAA
jgi:hypothetical protein